VPAAQAAGTHFFIGKEFLQAKCIAMSKNSSIFAALFKNFHKLGIT
jgi:hypothetical protein